LRSELHASLCVRPAKLQSQWSARCERCFNDLRGGESRARPHEIVDAERGVGSVDDFQVGRRHATWGRSCVCVCVCVCACVCVCVFVNTMVSVNIGRKHKGAVERERAHESTRRTARPVAPLKNSSMSLHSHSSSEWASQRAMPTITSLLTNGGGAMCTTREASKTE
jgi:hypothetical protein